MIHLDVWQKPTQHCKAVILQLKQKQNKKPFQALFLEVEEDAQGYPVTITLTPKSA